MEETLRMATGPSYRVAFRRRREGKTDYQLRRGLVVSRLPRLVIRGTLRNVSAQLIEPEVAGDRVIASAHSRELVKNYGLLGDTGNVSAAYLTGLLCGFKAVNIGVKRAVFDAGLQYPSKGARIFAALKGALDAGLVMSFDKKTLPDEKRIMGQHITDYAKRLSSTPEAYQKQFSAMSARGFKPENINDNLKQVKENIVSALKKAETSPGKAEAVGSEEESEESEEEGVEEE